MAKPTVFGSRAERVRPPSPKPPAPGRRLASWPLNQISYQSRSTLAAVVVAAAGLLASSAHAAATIYNLGTLGGTDSSGTAINASGQVAGTSYTTAGVQHAFLYTGTPGSGGAMVDLGTLGGTYSLGTAINASGQVGGYSRTTGNAAVHAFLYTGTPGSGGAMADLAKNPSRNRVLRNLMHKSGGLPGGQETADNASANDDPGFVDPAVMDFRLKPDAEVLKTLPKLAEILVGKMGLQEDEYRSLPKAKLLFRSNVLRGGQDAEKLELSVRGVRELCLIVEDGGDGNTDDHANWAAAELVSKDGTVTRLSALEPASSGYHGGEATRDLSRMSTPLGIASKTFDHGIGTHAPSELRYRLDGKFETFRAAIGVDNSSGGKGSVPFKIMALSGRSQLKGE